MVPPAQENLRAALVDNIAKMYRTSHDLEMSLQLACSSLERVPVGCGKKLLRANRVVAENELAHATAIGLLEIGITNINYNHQVPRICRQDP